MGIKVIVTGVTGMVGEGVMYECMQHPDVAEVLVIARKHCGHTHPKLKEIIHQDFYDLTPIHHQLSGYDGCFLCLGTTSIGKNEPTYTKITHTLTMHVAKVLSAENKNMVCCYVSGAGTDSSEKGKSMWARVKGRTENDLMKLPFKKVYAFRPGYIKPTPGLQHTLSFYKYINWMYPAFRAIFPQYACTLKEVGIAMVHTVTKGYEKPVLEVKDIVALAKR